MREQFGGGCSNLAKVQRERNMRFQKNLGMKKGN